MKRTIFAAGAVLLFAQGLHAQTPPQGAAKLQATVVAALKAIASGDCPAKLMAPITQYQCQQNLAAMQSSFDQTGALQRATFVGIQQMPNGVPAEVYRVQFERREMLWVATADQGGRLTMLWTQG